MALDFEIIATDDTTKLIVGDLSDWTGLTGSELSILLPECTEPEIVSLTRNQLNLYSMLDLAVTQERLPDGVYEVTIKDTSGGNSTLKNHLKVSNLTRLKDQLLLDCLEDPKSLKLLIQDLSIVDLYIDAAFAFLRQGDINKTKMYYNRAKSAIESLLNCR